MNNYTITISISNIEAYNKEEALQSFRNLVEDEYATLPEEFKIEETI